MSESQPCMYCEGPVRGVKNGEHIVQAALGATRTLKCVCADCNGAFSDVDRELASRSPLQTVMWEELDKTSENIWDYNDELNLAIEAKAAPNGEGPILFPQLVLTEPTPVFFFDAEEVEDLGLENAMNSFRAQLAAAIATVHAGQKRARVGWERLRNLPRRGQYPPRVFSRRRFEKFNEKMNFTCRFHGQVDQEQILNQAEEWCRSSFIGEPKTSWSVLDPESHYSCRPRWVLRALVKTGLNLLRHVCSLTSVNPRTFRDAIQFARYDRGSGPSLEDSGYLIQHDTQTLMCPPDAHLFRLSYGQNWALDCAFFGGRIGATVAFPGPNREEWNRADIIVPIKDHAWKISTSKILVPRLMRTTDQIDQMIRGVQIRNVQTRTRREPRR